jgi:ABC-type branched-subunit amino acid transport system substrate-binding protein
MSRRLLTGVAAAFLLAGCGTTVPLTSTTNQGPAELGTVGQSPASALSGGTTTATGGGVVPGSTNVPAGGQLPVGTQPSAAAGAPVVSLPSLAPLTSGRGYTATTLTVGIVVITGTDSAASAFGVSGADSGDLGEQFEVVQKYVNAQGGVAGRRLDVVRYDVDLISALNNPDQAAAAVCAAFTQDRKVFAVLLPLPTSQQRVCLAKAQTPMIEADSYTIGQPEYDRYPELLFGAGRITTDRVVQLLVSSLKERRFFTGWDTSKGAPGNAPVKIGMLYAENPEATYTALAEKRALAAIGLKVDDTVTYSSSVQAGLSATQNAILKFKAEGITHVLGASAFFLQGAENQQYRPRYVLPPGVGQLYAGNAPAAQLAGSMTVGWQPANDVDAAQDPGDVSPAETLCKKLMRDAGQSYSSRPALASMTSVCDVVFFLRDAVAGQSNPTNAGLRQGAEALGTTWQSAQTFVSRFSSTQHASAAAVRDQGFDPACSCVKYVSRTNRTA